MEVLKTAALPGETLLPKLLLDEDDTVPARFELCCCRSTGEDEEEEEKTLTFSCDRGTARLFEKPADRDELSVLISSDIIMAGVEMEEEF